MAHQAGDQGDSQPVPVNPEDPVHMGGWSQTDEDLTPQDPGHSTPHL